MSTPGNPVLYLLTPPQKQSAAARWGLPLAHLAYRVGNGPHLFRTQLPTPPTGGIMVLDHREFDGRGKAEPICQEVVRECAARNFQGVFCDFEGVPLPILERVVTLLGQTLQNRGWSFYIPMSYATCSSSGKVVVPTALSGGSLRHHLREAIDIYGLERVAIGLQWSCEDFSLPAKNGSGVPLAASELTDLCKKRHPNIYFSNDLCANYFTYMRTGESPHFILFDDAQSMRKKLDLAREMGIREAFLPYPEKPEELSKLLDGNAKKTP